MPFFKPFSAFFPRRVYLDYASSAPVSKNLARKIPHIAANVSGANPSALHTEGVEAKKYLQEARARVASALSVQPAEIIFTASATESDNLAIRGVVGSFLAKGIAPEHIALFSGPIEHSAVTEPFAHYEGMGMTHVFLYAPNGVVDPKSILLPPNCTAGIVSVMYVNNEIGTVQPIAEIAKRIKLIKKENPDIELYFHVDATQAPMYFSLRVPKLHADLLTLGSTKLPIQNGVGVLYKKRSLQLSPVLFGGGQEQGIRPGTPALPLIHTFSYALSMAQEAYEAQYARVKALQVYVEKRLLRMLPHLRITAANEDRTPHITYVAIENFDSELVVIELDARGISVSSKSACKNEDSNESELIEGIYGKGVGGVRFSFSPHTTKRELRKAVRALQDVLQKYAS